MSFSSMDKEILLSNQNPMSNMFHCTWKSIALQLSMLFVSIFFFTRLYTFNKRTIYTNSPTEWECKFSYDTGVFLSILTEDITVELFKA